jgi:benzoate/toluate 1,2-dioxygenase beta subunit
VTADTDTRPFERFLFREARLLDGRRFDDWLALFAPDGWYWVPLEEGQASPDAAMSIVYDDRRMLEVRVRRLAASGAHALSPPPRTSRIVGNVEVETIDGEGVELSSRFQLVEFRLDRQRLYAGAARHRLVRGPDGFRIAWKRVDLVDCDGMIEGISILF